MTSTGATMAYNMATVATQVTVAGKEPVLQPEGTKATIVAEFDEITEQVGADGKISAEYGQRFAMNINDFNMKMYMKMGNINNDN